MRLQAVTMTTLIGKTLRKKTPHNSTQNFLYFGIQNFIPWVDVDSCNKAFNEKRDFIFGVFSICCCYELNITYGFELMLNQESAQKKFRLFMCRQHEMTTLEGVIFNHACGLDAYILNREPREYEFLRCLVDGSHWQLMFVKNEQFRGKYFVITGHSNIADML